MSDLSIGARVTTYSGKRGVVIARELGVVTVRLDPFRTNYHAGKFATVRNLVVTYPIAWIEVRHGE